MKRILLLSVFTLFLFPAFSQSSESDSIAIMSIIEDVFDGMRESDTSKMAPYFHESAQMQSLVVSAEGNNVSKLSGPEGWLNAVANNNSGTVWNEQVNNIKIISDGAVATAWMDYTFYLGDQLSHCGINSFQFIKMNEKWKIIYIIDSRFKNKCDQN
ncbi:nuclear transport factor 2 family protein [Marivirga arenosa]|uniref:Nuclear transport factor 2 family protein n=1 Tax=Marivirga arenosa TaxID=3059076 RepID=A0AA51N4K5_9BACT|nr:nuclear transport factor 2 family protein [Marivirga sp. ABR2-2]WMN05923.1 nuclear transport factor 2 family protein [Marivirga sp. ABR2-2]